jgi:hypothetical protein
MTDPYTPDHDDSHLVRTLRNCFITGLVVTGPVLITLFLVWRFIGFLDGSFREVVMLEYPPHGHLGHRLCHWEPHRRSPGRHRR